MLERMEEESWRGGKDKVRGNGRRRLKGLDCKGVYIGGGRGTVPPTPVKGLRTMSFHILFYRLQLYSYLS